MLDSDFWQHILYLSFFSLWGVATRIFINSVFASQNALGADITTTPKSLSADNGMTALFNDLPSNILGCFFFGIAVPAATIGLASGASIALFDSNHPYQKNKYIQTGFRTGYCGSVTTYATWNTGMVLRFFTKRQWIMALWGYFLGLGMTIFGMHLGRMMPLFWQNTGSRASKSRENRVTFLANNQAPNGIDRSTRATSFSMKPLGSSLSASHTLAQPLLGDDGSQSVDTNSFARTDSTDLDEVTTADDMRKEDDTLKATTVKVFVMTVFLVVGLVVASILDKQNNTDGNARQLYEAVASSKRMTKTRLLIEVFDEVFSRQGLWIGILFGPPGACLRWWLGKHLNGAVDNFFLGTWVANMLASVLDTIIAAIALRENVSGTTWMLVFSFSNGFNGSLSTVSTWLNEVDSLMPKKGDGKTPWYAVRYALITIGAIGGLTCAIFGATFHFYT